VFGKQVGGEASECWPTTRNRTASTVLIQASAAQGRGGEHGGMPASMASALTAMTILRAGSTRQPRRISQPEAMPPAMQQCRGQKRNPGEVAISASVKCRARRRYSGSQKT